MKNKLFDKVMGCYAGGSIGAAMGAAVEWVGLPHGGYHAIYDQYGWVTEPLPWKQVERDVRYWNGFRLHYYAMDLPAGMTEDGTELKHLLSTAIIEKGGRVTVNDLAKIWIRDIDKNKIGYLINPHIVMFYDRLSAGNEITKIPRHKVGEMTHWPGNVDIGMMVSPLGIINACNPEQAALDAFEVSTILQSPYGYGLDIAAAICAAIAEAFKPDATIDSIIDASKRYIQKPVAEIIDEGIEIAIKYGDIKSVRDPFYKKYSWLPAFDGLEVLSEAMCLFYVTKGDPKETIIGGTNFGRDTDCIACIAGAIAGAYSGAEKLPLSWINTVEKAISENTNTVQSRSMKETAENLYNVLEKLIKEKENELKQLNNLKLL